MVLVNRNVAPSFNTIIEILQNDQRKIKLIRKYENTQKKIINNECAILFNKTCIYIYITTTKLTKSTTKLWDTFNLNFLALLCGDGEMYHLLHLRLDCVYLINFIRLEKKRKYYYKNNMIPLFTVTPVARH